MKIEYKFVDRTVTEIEVDGSLAKFMLEMKNEGDNLERKETRRHVLLSAMDPDDRYFDSGRDTLNELAEKDELERLAAAIGRVQPQQRELLRRIKYAPSGRGVHPCRIFRFPQMAEAPDGI